MFSYHLLYFCTALCLIIMLSSHYHHHKSKTFSHLTQCPFTGTLLLLPKMAKHKIASISLTVRDRAISSKFSTHRVSKEGTLQFSKIFPLPKNGGHFEFLAKMSKHKIASISLTVRDRAISSKFSTHRVSNQGTLCNFQKISPPQKWRTFCIFGFLAKMAKHKIVSISLTVRDRAISSQFSTHRISKEGTLCNSQKNFPSPKMAAILYFRIFAKNGKTQNCFYLLNRAR